MQRVPTTLGGFRGLRAELLVALKKAPHPLSAKELAEQFGVTPNALRRHLDSLEAEELVRHSREVRGVGAPVHAYSLTAAGEALFPQGHAAVLAAVLDSVREVAGSDGVAALARRQWAGYVEHASPRLAELPLHERAQLVAELRSSQGFMAEAHVGDGAAVIREHHCAIRDVAERFPEICAAEQEFVERMLAVKVERTAHMLDGCSCCEYTARPERAADASSADVSPADAPSSLAPPTLVGISVRPAGPAGPTTAPEADDARPDQEQA